MDIDAVAKKIRQAVMDSAEDQGRTFNASSLDDVIAKELRLHWPVAPSAPASYPWAVVPMAGSGGGAAGTNGSMAGGGGSGYTNAMPTWESIRDALVTGASMTITHIPDEEWR